MSSGTGALRGPGRTRWVVMEAGALVLLLCSVVAHPPRRALADETLEKTSRKGPVEARVRLEPTQPRIGDPIHLTLTVTADKGVELIMPEFGEVMERFTISDFVKDEKIDEQGRTVATHRYELQAARSGKQTIPAILVEFVDRRAGSKPAPEGFDSYELMTERIPFEIASVLPGEDLAELNPPLGKLAPRGNPKAMLWAWAMGAVLMLGGGFWGWRLWRGARRRARRRSAYEVAMDRLMKLLARPRRAPAEIDTFFVELSALVRWYLENRFDLRAPELTTEEFLDSMSRSPGLSPEHQALLRDFLHRADLVKFANFLPSAEDIDQSVIAARRFLEETRQALDDPSVPARALGEAARA